MASGDAVHRLHPNYTAAARHVAYHSAASLTFLVWTFLLMLDDEVEYIWTMRNTNLFKWVYFFLRYAVILGHITHTFLIEHLANGTNPRVLCNVWFVYVSLLSQTVETSLELILASRVFALYNRSKKVAVLLTLLVLTELVGMMRMLSMRPLAEFHGTCLLIKASKDYHCQTLLGFLVHCTLIGLTLFKYYVALKAGWGRTPLVSLVVRDSSTVYITIIVLTVSVVATCGLHNEQGIAVVFWVTAIISVSGCRMILRMERFARGVLPSSPELVLTSELNIFGPRDIGRTLTIHQGDSNIGPPPTLGLNGNRSCQ